MANLTTTLLLLVHSWYPSQCCSDTDCQPITGERVQAMPGEYVIDGKYHIKYKDVKQSPDGDYHACISYDSLHCFFAPGGA